MGIFVDKKGIILVTAIILIIFVGITTFGITAFIIQRLSQEQGNQEMAKYIYLAQAGVHNAIYSYRFHNLTGPGYFALGQVPIDANNLFVLGGTAADLLMVDTSGSNIGGSGNRNLQGLKIQNATNSKTITIYKMIINWDKPAFRLQQIRVNNKNVFNGNLSSPASASVNVILNTPSIRDINYIRFNGDMRGTNIKIQFVMTIDGSISKTLPVFPASPSYSFTVKSTGKTTGSNIYRTIQAEYNAFTGKIIDYHEINSQVTP